MPTPFLSPFVFVHSGFYCRLPNLFWQYCHFAVYSIKSTFAPFFLSILKIVQRICKKFIYFLFLINITIIIVTYTIIITYILFDYHYITVYETQREKWNLKTQQNHN